MPRTAPRPPPQRAGNSSARTPRLRSMQARRHPCQSRGQPEPSQNQPRNLVTTIGIPSNLLTYSQFSPTTPRRVIVLLKKMRISNRAPRKPKNEVGPFQKFRLKLHRKTKKYLDTQTTCFSTQAACVFLALGVSCSCRRAAWGFSGLRVCACDVAASDVAGAECVWLCALAHACWQRCSG